MENYWSCGLCQAERSYWILLLKAIPIQWHNQKYWWDLETHAITRMLHIWYSAFMKWQNWTTESKQHFMSIEFKELVISEVLIMSYMVSSLTLGLTGVMGSALTTVLASLKGTSSSKSASFSWIISESSANGNTRISNQDTSVEVRCFFALPTIQFLFRKCIFNWNFNQQWRTHICPTV